MRKLISGSCGKVLCALSGNSSLTSLRFQSSSTGWDKGFIWHPSLDLPSSIDWLKIFCGIMEQNTTLVSLDMPQNFETSKISFEQRGSTYLNSARFLFLAGSTNAMPPHLSACLQFLQRKNSKRFYIMSSATKILPSLRRLPPEVAASQSFPPHRYLQQITR